MQDPRVQRRRHTAPLPMQPMQQQVNIPQQPQQPQHILQRYPSLQYSLPLQQHLQASHFDNFQSPCPPPPPPPQQQLQQHHKVQYMKMQDTNATQVQQHSATQPAYFVNQPSNAPNSLNASYAGPSPGNMAYPQKAFDFANGPDVANLPNAFHGAQSAGVTQLSNIGSGRVNHVSDGTMPPPSVQFSQDGNLAHAVSLPNTLNYPAGLNSPATNILGSDQISAAANAPSGPAHPISSHSSPHSTAVSGTFDGTYQGHTPSQTSALSSSGPSSSSVPSSASVKSMSSVASSIPSPTVMGMLGNSEGCNCGDDCNCTLCPVHYFNQSTVSGMQDILRTILEEQSEENSPASMPDYVPNSIVPSDLLLSPTDQPSGILPVPYLSAPPEHPDQTQGAMGRTTADNGDTFIYLMNPSNTDSAHLANTGNTSCCNGSSEISNPNMAIGDFFEGAYNTDTIQYDEQFS